MTARTLQLQEELEACKKELRVRQDSDAAVQQQIERAQAQNESLLAEMEELQLRLDEVFSISFSCC